MLDSGGPGWHGADLVPVIMKRSFALHFDVVGLGAVVVDHLVVLPGWPEADSKTTVRSDRFQVGGPVPTALTLLQRWGWRGSFIGGWADDPFGHMIEADFQREGLDYRMAAGRRTDRTGFAHVWVDQATGSRTIACHRPAAGAAATALDEAALARTKLLHLDGWAGETAIEAARIVRRHGGTVVLDTGSPKAHTAELLRHVDIVNCPRRFLGDFLETDDPRRGAAALLAMGPRMVTITTGAAGAALATADRLVHRDAFAVAAVDTTGAGDVFCGALLHGLLCCWSASRMLEFAMAAAAAKCRGLGNREALPTVAEVEALMRTRGGGGCEPVQSAPLPGRVR